MSQQKKFSALYYPYSRCLREVDLKRMVLIFDEILFVDPLSRDLEMWPGQYPVSNQNMNIRIMQDSDRLEDYIPVLQRGVPEEDFPIWKWFDIRKAYSILQSEGVAKLLRPESIVQENDKLLSYAVITDWLQGLANSAGLSPFFAGDDDPKWILHHQRIPSSLIEFGEDDSLWKEIASYYKKYKERDWCSRGRNIEVCRRLVWQTVEAKEQSKDDKAAVPYDIAYSLILNQALLLCEKYSVSPVTDDGGVHRSLLIKCKDMYSDDRSAEIIYKRRPVDAYKIMLFTLNVVGRMLPDTALNALTIEQILEYRVKNHKLLEKFWGKMVEFSSMCEKMSFDADSPREVTHFIESKVIPEINELDEALNYSYKELFRTPISKLLAETAKIIAPSIPTMSLAALFGLAPGQIVAIGASALLSSIGIVLPDLISDLDKHEQLSQNGLAYLLRVPLDPEFGFE